MTGAWKRKRWLLIVGVLLVVSADFLVWCVYSRHHSPRWRLAPSSSATADDDGPELSRGYVDDEPREDTGSGVIRIRVRDAASGQPISGATCVVYAERHGQHEYGVVQTDHEGLATLGDLPENSILVHVLRNPPHASGYGGVWLPDGATRDVDVKLTAGGTMSGRAIDDVGHPIAGAEVRFDSEPWMPKSLEHVEPALVTRTDDAGRFEVANVISDPRSVWIVNGEMRPAWWGNVRVRIQAGITSETADAEIADGGRVDLGDIVIPRSCTYSGRILDAHHVPVDGARVEVEEESTRHWGRVIPPAAGQPHDALNSGCALTTHDGAFSIEYVRPSPRAVVTTREGMVQTFSLPDIGPGAHANNIELVFDESSLLAIELVDESGSRVARAAGAVSGVDFPNDQYPSSDDYSANMRVVLTLSSEPVVDELLKVDSDWLFRVQTRRTVDVPRRLRISLSGYTSIDEDIGVQSAAVEHLRFTMHPLPGVHLHVHVTDQPRGAQELPRLRLHACLLDPKQLESDPTGHRCCGQGSIWRSDLSSADEDVTMPVLGPGNYWIYARVPVTHPPDNRTEHPVWTRWEQHFGPFAADGVVHELDIPPLAAEVFTRRKADDRPKPEPPEPSVPQTSEAKIR